MDNTSPDVFLAALCLPDRITDPDLRVGVDQYFGGRPAWVVTLPENEFEEVQARKAAGVLQFGACRPPGFVGTCAVMVIQVSQLQVRCVLPLDNPDVRSALQRAEQDSVIQVAFGRRGRPTLLVAQYEGTFRGLRDVLALDCLGEVDVGEQRESALDTAARCSRMDEVPSLIKGAVVARASVSVVLPDYAPFLVDGFPHASAPGAAMY